MVIEMQSRSSSGEQQSIEREVSNEEFQDIVSWGELQNSPLSVCYAWLSRLVQVKQTDEYGAYALSFKGYDEDRTGASKVSGVESVKTDLKHIFMAHQDKVRRDSEMAPRVSLYESSEQERKQQEMDVATRRLKIPAETSEVLHDCYRHVGNGHFDEEGFGVFLRNLCQASDRVMMDKAQVHRLWHEARSYTEAGLVHFLPFADWMLSKFPHIKHMTAWELRKIIVKKS